jgi:hypothetical protein
MAAGVVLLFGKNRFHIGFDMKTVFAEKQHHSDDR